MISLIIFLSPFLKIAAIVNDDLIFDYEVKEIAKVVMLSPSPQQIDTLKTYAEILDQLISYELLKVEMEKESLQISPEQVTTKVEEYLNVIKQNFPNDSLYNEALKQTGMTEEKLKKTYRKEIERQIMVQMLLGKKEINIYVSPKEIREFYKEYKDSISYIPEVAELSYIALPILPSPRKEKQAQQRVTEIYNILAQNADFDVVAASFSDDEKTKRKGGLIKIKRGDFLEPVEKILFSMNPGQISDPMRLQDGYYIFKCIRKGVNEGTFRQIVVKVLPNRDDTLRIIKKAKEIKKEFLRGKDFHELAKKYSQDPNSAPKGGRMGTFIVENLFSPFKEIVETLDQNQCSDPFISDMGVNIIYVDSKQERKERTFEELKEEIYFYLLQKKQNEIVDDIVEEVKKNTYIDKRLYRYEPNSNR